MDSHHSLSQAAKLFCTLAFIVSLVAKIPTQWKKFRNKCLGNFLSGLADPNLLGTCGQIKKTFTQSIFLRKTIFSAASRPSEVLEVCFASGLSYRQIPALARHVCSIIYQLSNQISEAWVRIPAYKHKMYPCALLSIFLHIEQ